MANSPTVKSAEAKLLIAALLPWDGSSWQVPPSLEPARFVDLDRTLKGRLLLIDGAMGESMNGSLAFSLAYCLGSGWLSYPVQVRSGGGGSIAPKCGSSAIRVTEYNTWVGAGNVNDRPIGSAM